MRVCVGVHVCVVSCVCVFCFDLGDILYKKKTHGQKSGLRQSFHTELDVFYGNLVNFSLYFFFTYNYIYI